MRALTFWISFLAATSASYAACNDQILTVENWSIKSIDADTNRLETTFKSNFTKPIRMIDGSAGFRDALGQEIGRFSLTRDVDVSPGGTFTQTGTWGQYTFERLLDLKPEETEAFTCVRSVLFEDGTREDFE